MARIGLEAMTDKTQRKVLYEFYDVQTDDELIDRMEQHIEKLIDRVKRLDRVEPIRTKVREG